MHRWGRCKFQMHLKMLVKKGQPQLRDGEIRMIYMNLSGPRYDLPPKHGDQPILHAFLLLDRLEEELGAGECHR